MSLVERLRNSSTLHQQTEVTGWALVRTSDEEAMRIEAADEIERLLKLIDYIGTSGRGGGELYPVGPSDTEYAKDGNTVLRDIGPWRFKRGIGDTFIAAVEDAMKKDGA